MGTGIKPTGDRDYDIDVGLVFDITANQYPDPTEVKGWVEMALSNYPRTVEMKDACVRVQYHRRGDIHYHVDFAVYATARSFSNALKIAKGRKRSLPQNKNWEDSSPKKLKELINSKFSYNTEHNQQFKRIIRYLKKWKDVQFSASGNGAPTGIALTAIAYQWFQPCFEGRTARDLIALCKLLETCIRNSYGLNVQLPVPPYNDLFESIKASTRHQDHYKNKLHALKDALAKTCNSHSEAEAVATLREQFSNDFPK
jgi:hypothetical protein